MNGDSVIPSQKILTRHEKEMAIQISEMEKYKYLCSEKIGNDVGKKAYFEWAQRYGCKVRVWLESLSDDEVNLLFEKISERIKNYIIQKTR
jgi:hypothetical protein